MQTKAIIIKKQNTGEYDQWITCYTEEFGKVTAVAKSILKPNSIQAMHLDVFNLVEFDLINGRGMPIITGAQVEFTFSNLKSCLSATAIAYFFAEVVEKISFEYQKDEELWRFLVQFFSNLNILAKDKNHNITSCDLGGFFRDRQSAFLTVLGYQPNWKECGYCNAVLD